VFAEFRDGKSYAEEIAATSLRSTLGEAVKAKQEGTADRTFASNVLKAEETRIAKSVD
jgi:hypothetical protein